MILHRCLCWNPPSSVTSSPIILSRELCSWPTHFQFSPTDLLGRSIFNSSLKLFHECQIEENMTSAKEGYNFLVMPDPPWMQRVKNKFWFNSGGHQRHPVKGVERDPQNSEKNIKSLAFAETGETTCVKQRKWTEIRMKKNWWLPAAILNFQQVRTQHTPETPITAIVWCILGSSMGNVRTDANIQDGVTNSPDCTGSPGPDFTVCHRIQLRWGSQSPISSTLSYSPLLHGYRHLQRAYHLLTEC